MTAGPMLLLRLLLRLMLALSPGMALADIDQTMPGPQRDVATTYVLKCIGCHMADGRGLPQAGIPDFVNAIGYFAGSPEGRAYLVNVPNVRGAGLSDAATAELLNFIIDVWGGTSRPRDFVPFDAPELARLKRQATGNVVDMRRDVVARLTAEGLHPAAYPWP